MALLKDFLPASATLYGGGHMTELFYSQGSIGALAVGENSGSGSGNLEISLQKSYTDCREPRFASTCPALPLCSPNRGTNNSKFHCIFPSVSPLVSVPVWPFCILSESCRNWCRNWYREVCRHTPSLTPRARSKWLV